MLDQALDQARARGDRRERLVLAALSVALLVVVLRNDWGVLTPDTKPELYLAPGRTLQRSFAAWLSDPYLGGPSYNVGLAPVAALLTPLHALGVEPWLLVRLWRVALLILAAAGARQLYREVAPDGGPTPLAVGGVATAVAYVVNPYVVVGGSTTPTLLPYALLPWSLLCLRRALLRPAGWRWPAAFALVFTAMGGINVAVVPILQLVALPALVVDAHVRDGVPWRHGLATCARALLLSAMLACYWLVPALAAVEAGEAVAETTESLDAIGAPSSFAEVMRGLGFWPLYGADADGPFLPGYTDYVGSPPIILLSFGLPLLAAVGALVSRSRARLLAVLLVLVAAVTMVGLHPSESPTLYGRALRWFFDSVPGAVALRTTNKAGGVLMLGLALLVGLGAAAIVRRLRTPSRRVVALVPVVAIAAGSVAPAVTGQLWPVRMPVPGYWHEAARDLDSTDDPGRVLLVPGVAQVQYRWGYQGTDELGNSLLDRSTAVRTTVPNGSPYAANLLAGLDLGLQDRSLSPGALSDVAAYLGTSDVLARHDLVWEAAAGARPSEVASVLAADKGLRARESYGRRGEQTGGPGRNDVERELQPLQRYSLVRPAVPVRAATAPLVVDGDGAALPDLARAGLLRSRPPVLLAGSLDDAALRRALEPGGRVVLTDGNRRRGWGTHRLAGGVGPLLPAARDPGPTRALFGVSDQTVLEVTGAGRAASTGQGLVFGPVPYGRPEAAFDGDPSTAWLVGNFGTGVGNALRLQLPGPRRVEQVVLHPQRGGSERIATVRVRAGDVTRSVTVPPIVPATGIPVPLGAQADSVVIEITGIDGYGINPVGFTEVEVEGVRLQAAARLPTRFVDRLSAGSPQLREQLSATPLDVVLARSTSDPTTAADDEEARLDRIFRLPDARSFTLSGTVRAAVSSADASLDALGGRRTRVRTTTSSRAFDSPALRGSFAFDDKADGTGPELGTAWIPSEPVVGEWLDVRFPRRDVDSVTIVQSGGTAGADAASIGFADRAELLFDDGTRYVVPLQPTVSQLPVRVRGATGLRISLLGRVGSGPVRIADVALEGVRTSPGVVGAAPPPRCLQVGTIDGQPLRVRVTGSAGALSGGGAVPVVGCDGKPLRLAAGEHVLRGAGAWVLDHLHLADAGVRAGPTGPPPAVEVVHRGGPSAVARISASDEPYYLVGGEGFDSRWRARLDGDDLGPPMLLDGYSIGWRITDGRPHTLVLDYAPQRATRVAYLCFLALLGLTLVLLVLPPRQVPRQPGRWRALARGRWFRGSS